MTDPHEAKYKEMQKYVPFIQRVIEKLKVNNDHQADNPRQAQLQKMEMLYDLLTNKHKKIKIETLLKCEGVLMKLQAKIEKQTTILQNDDSLLNDVVMKPQTSDNSHSKNTKDQDEDLGPASPPPETAPADDIDQPVVIPTERRCSPIRCLDKTNQHQRDSNSCKNENFQNLRKKIFETDCKSSVSTSKQLPSHEKNVSSPVHQKHHHTSHKSTYHDYHHGKDSKQHKNFNPNSNLPSKEKNTEERNKSFVPEQKLQTVKVVITEPLPAHFRHQHFPPTSKFLPRTSVCHNNLRSLPLASQTKMNTNEAYSPEESWDKYNESHNKKTNERSPSTAPVFSRLGAKVTEGSPKSSKSPGRYTPIPDVLKSPPLSVNDINNLLLESGADNTLNDISEIGTRRSPKIENQQMASPNNSFEFIRKKLAQTARLNSPKSEKDDSPSPMPNERLALKYNPHPRQERLQSVSSTEGSECSVQSRTYDPRIKHSPSLVAASNVNVLPAINLSDPRLKRQTTPLLATPPPQERKPIISTPPSFTSSTSNMGVSPQNSLFYGRRQDPRISHITNNALSVSSSTKTPPIRRMSTSQPHYSSEENWDSDEEEKTQRPSNSNPRLPHLDQYKSESNCNRSTSIERAHCDNNNKSCLAERETLNPTHLQKTAFNQFNDNFKQNSPKDPILVKNGNKNKLESTTIFLVPNAPKSDTEEDWDAEPEITNAIPVKPLINEVPLPSPNIPRISPLHSQISPKPFISPKPNTTTNMPPVHLAHMSQIPHVSYKPYVPHIPHVQPQYPLVGSNTHHSYRPPHQHSQPNNRFNSMLNDTSERLKYFEAKKQKSVEPRTYKEFREAKERALAKEAAIKRAEAEEAESQKRAKELQEKQNETASSLNVNESKVKPNDSFKQKTEADKKEKKPQTELNKSLAGESTLDKMYRTQNFSTSFPKTTTGFKIPKKKTEENNKEVAKKAINIQANQSEANGRTPTATRVAPAVPGDQEKHLSEDKPQGKLNSNPADNTTSVNIKSDKQEFKKSTDKKKENRSENLEKCNKSELILSKEKGIEKDTPQITTTNATIQLPRPMKTEKISSAHKQKEKDEEEKDSEEKHRENLSDSDITTEDIKINKRDPRFKQKPTDITVVTKEAQETMITEEENKKIEENQVEKSKTLGNMAIAYLENQVNLKPKNNLEIFNQLTQESSSPKPQRILRRRNTMVVFDSAPLVDKEKLRKANALLFEDVQEEEKRKRKEAEEERLIARRNKNLEDMFKRTDDNCTVSTQNIITGKRRTRATINFNETVNAINVFKHIKNLKDTPPTSNVTPVTAKTIQGAKSKSNFKIKLKNLGSNDRKKDDEGNDEDDEPLVKIAVKKEGKESHKSKSKLQSEKAKGVEEEDIKSDAFEMESKPSTKSTKKCAINNRNEDKWKTRQAEEHQNCAVSSTSTDNDNIEETTCSSTSTNKSFKKETDDNEPTSTGSSKSNNPTPVPTPEPTEPVLQEIVDQILKPNSNREPILAILAQILSEEKLTLIKSLIESSNNQNEEQTAKDVEEDTDKQITKNNEKVMKRNEDGNDNEEEQELKPVITNKVSGGKKIVTTAPKKKRNELDRLNEDIRDMFICNGVITATGRRMCTMMGKNIPSSNNKESTPSPPSKQQNNTKRKSEILKPPTTTRSLRRSTRSCKTAEDNDDNESILSRTTEDSNDGYNDTSESDATPPGRKMPVLKPQTPIKIPQDTTSNKKPKETTNKRKSDIQFTGKAKKAKTFKDDTKENSESEENENDSEKEMVESADEGGDEETNKKEIIKNTNLHWHNQSKYSIWCMICEKKISAYTSSIHYKTHHRENYISRMAPIILQQYKQGKLSQPLFGVKRNQKQPTWFYRCPFCLKYFNTALPLWLEHFQNHTVEFRYECSKCYRSNNRRLNIVRHIKNCAEGATVLSSPVKLNIPTVINAHVCHLCNFVQLKRDNLERHYMEQHQLLKKTIDLLGYTITLFDVGNVECVNEEKAAEKEKEAWKSIEENEQVIDIDDDDANSISSKNNDSVEKEVVATSLTEETHTEVGGEIFEIESVTNKNNLQQQKVKQLKVNAQTVNLTEEEQEEPFDETGPVLRKTTKIQTKKSNQQQEKIIQSLKEQETVNKLQKKNVKDDDFEVIDEDVTVQNMQEELLILAAQAKETVNELQEKNVIEDDFEVIDQEVTVQNIQDELLALAAKAAEIEKVEEEENNMETEDGIHETLHITNTSQKLQKITPIEADVSSKTSSIEVVDNPENKLSSQPKTVCQAASNVFMPTRDDSNYSPTIQILAQSIINIDEPLNHSVKEKPITIADRLSQRFKDLQADTSSLQNFNDSSKTPSAENAFEKLIDDTLLELTKEKDCANKHTISADIHTAATEAESAKENVFNKLFSDTVLDLERDEVNSSDNQLTTQPEPPHTSKELPPNNAITVISDDEDWEDIEITETAPTQTTTAAGQNQKSKNKGLFQKFGIFKANSNKSKKHLPPMVFLPKKKTKEKPSPLVTTMPPLSPITNLTTTISSPSANKTNETSNTSTINSNSANLGFKPVVNIMDGLFPDSPCNDPIELIPELAPFEPLQDLNDISSILDSNLSAVNINAADNHTSIEDALDFVSEQQENDKQKSSSLSLTPSQATKTTTNNICHVGFSVQTSGENGFKFYCLLQNCPFLFSSDSIGLETHFLSEHSQIKWNGYCFMCQAQGFPNPTDASGEYPISKEIRHMMEKHALKPALDLNADSTQNSNSSTSHDNEERPKIKLRRLTGDCLSRSTPENVTPNNEMLAISVGVANEITTPLSMLGALLVAQPKPPTKEMPPQLQLPLTEPLLLATNTEAPFRNANSDFLITSVTSAAAPQPKPSSLQISSVVSLNNENIIPQTGNDEQIQIPKISAVRTLTTNIGSVWSQQIENDRLELMEAAEESLEVSRILENASNPSTTNREITRSENDSPVLLVAETVPIAQSKTGDFVLTQTLSAQYNEFSSTALGFNINIAASTANDNSIPEATQPNSSTSTTSSTFTTGSISSGLIASRQYKCMGSGCKFVSRVPVAMSDHLRFHERRNFSNKQDYLVCGFCTYRASDVDDYMKHANQFHIINKASTSAACNNNTPLSESDTATSLTKKIHSILNSKKFAGGQNKYTGQNQSPNPAKEVQESQEVYQKKLRSTIEEIVTPTGLADDKLYTCVIKNCHSQLTESTFLNHIMYHISTTGGNPNNYVYKCPHCTAQYHRPAGIKAHIKNHARNRYFCYLCEETSTNPGQMLKHFSEKHWHTLNMYTTELLAPKLGPDSSVIESNYFVAYTQELTDEEVRKFGEKLILEWLRRKTGLKTYFKSSEIDLLPMTAIFQRQLNCGECEYKTKVRTNMFRHLLMHKQNPGLAHEIGAASVVDPVNPVPCLNSNERFFDKMTNLASSSLIPSSSGSTGATSTSTSTTTTKTSFKLPQSYVEDSKRYVCGCPNCNYHTISDDLFRTHLTTVHSSEMTFTCPFCKEEVCKRGVSSDRIISHLRFHGVTLYRCGECNYFHHMRYVVERHINEKHSTLKVELSTHVRSDENSVNGNVTSTLFAGKNYNPLESIQTNKSTPGTNVEHSVTTKPTVTPAATNTKGKGKWECDVCGHKAITLNQMQSHCQQQHSIKNQYKCTHCYFGSQQLSQILYHIDETHAGKAREAQTIYHKIYSNSEEVADTRPLWQRNDPTRVRHIRGILMEDEEESEEHRKQLALTDDNESNEDQTDEMEMEETDDVVNVGNYIKGYEFACYHCSFKTQKFEDLRDKHYKDNHNRQADIAKPFWYRLHSRLCCPDCRSFLGNSTELQQHLHYKHKKPFYAADIKMAENDDTSQRIVCGYCTYHCAKVDHLYRHHLKAQHWPQDIRLDSNEHIMQILSLGKPNVSYQCTICGDIFPNKVAIVHHTCNSHASEESLSLRELSNSLIYRCSSCCFTSTVEIDLLRHSIDHYSPFKICSFCQKPQTSFNAYMQHCYEEHKTKIDKFRSLYPIEKIKTFLLQTLVIFPSGLVLNKRNLSNTQYGKVFSIDNLYEEICKISQQPPIPRLSIARLVARKSIEAQHKSEDNPSSSSLQDDVFNAMLPKSITKRRRTVAFDRESNNSLLKSNINNSEKEKSNTNLPKRRLTIDQHRTEQQQVKKEDFSVPCRANKICNRRRTVAVDRDTLFSNNLTPSTNNLLTELEVGIGKKRKNSFTHTQTPPSKYVKGSYPLNLDMEPFSFYGKKPEELDLSKIYTKVAIGGIKTPLTIDKFKLLFNIDCQLKLTKCDLVCHRLGYNNYKHIKVACPASEKLRYN